MTENIPKITETAIKQLSSEQSFSRGQSYYRGGALFELVCQDNDLRAYCEGSGYEPYRVSATLGPGGIQNTRCSCPYDWGGICKHIVALLLTWVHKPESFHTTPPLDEMLGNRSKEELIALIKEMLKRQPDLTRVLELPVQPDRHTPLDLDAFRRQIDYALRSTNHYDYPDAGATAAELSSIVDTATRFREAGDWANAGVLYTLILNEIVPQYEELYDDDGDVAVVLQSCTEGLDDCFIESDPDPETRQAWLEALLEAHLKDVEIGGIDLATPAGELVVGHATDAEWEWIEAQVRQSIVALSRRRYSSWGQEALVAFLAQRLEADKQEAATDELLFELGSPRQQAFLLVERGRFDEAMAIAKQDFTEKPGLVKQFAEALVEAGAGDTAEAYMAGLLDTRSGPSYLAWLAQRAEQKGDLTAALDWWRQSIDQSPSFQTYSTIQTIAEQLGQWPQVRQEVVTDLEKKELWHILIEIAMAEGDAARTLKLLPKLKGWYSRDYELKVAQAVEEEVPQAALDIYYPRITRLINARGRGNYQEAARLVVRVQDVYRHQNKQATWSEYITTLRRKHRNLPALQDELTKAGV